jgi:hypothetical protein
MASALQAAYNLGTISKLVLYLVTDLSDAVQDRIKQAFDLAKLSKITGQSKSPVSICNMPSLLTAFSTSGVSERNVQIPRSY